MAPDRSAHDTPLGNSGRLESVNVEWRGSAAHASDSSRRRLRRDAVERCGASAMIASSKSPPERT